MAAFRCVIYIYLLDEAVDVWLPTDGEWISEMIYKVLPTENYDPEDEHWEFPPGTTVRCEKQVKYNGFEKQEVLVAVEKV